MLIDNLIGVIEVQPRQLPKSQSLLPQYSALGEAQRHK